MSIESEHDLEAMKRVGRVTWLTLERMRQAVGPGITTAELDEIGRQVMQEHGARSAPQLFYRSLCRSRRSALIAATTSRTRELPDGWTVASADGSLTAHYEHTLVVRRGEPLLLTAA